MTTPTMINRVFTAPRRALSPAIMRKGALAALTLTLRSSAMWRSAFMRALSTRMRPNFLKSVVWV